MATYGPTLLPAWMVAAPDFRTWGSGIAAALAAVGLVQTADTGQINWATVSYPVSSAGGYEIYRFNDALQATAPFFLKIEYGTFGVDKPSLWLTVGTGTNGAGTLSGQVGTRVQTRPNNSLTAGYTLPVFASGDGSRFALCFHADAANYAGMPSWLVAERTRDASGAYTADGVVYMHQVANSTGGFGTVPFSAAVAAPAYASGSGAIQMLPPPPTTHTNLALTDAVLGTISYVMGGKPYYVLSVVEVHRLDVGSLWGVSWTATVLSAVHTFVSLLCPNPDVLNAVNGGTMFWGLLWE